MDKNKISKIEIVVGFSCNNNCVFCSVGNRNFDKTTYQVKEDIRKAAKETKKEINFTGGEPTIRKDILKIIKFCRKLDFDRIELQTNGRMLAYSTFAKKIVEYGITNVYISFHAPTETLQDFITQSKGSFKESIQGLRNILDLDVRLQTNTVISKLNYKVLGKLMIFFHDLKVREVELDFLRPMGNAWKHFDLVVPKKSEISPYLEDTLNIAEDLAFDNVFVDDYPLCFMKKFRQNNADYIAMLQGLKQHDEQGFSYPTPQSKPIQIHENQKAKGLPCMECSFGAHCEGDWNEYIQKMGWDEFKPIKDIENV